MILALLLFFSLSLAAAENPSHPSCAEALAQAHWEPLKAWIAEASAHKENSRISPAAREALTRLNANLATMAYDYRASLVAPYAYSAIVQNSYVMAEDNELWGNALQSLDRPPRELQNTGSVYENYYRTFLSAYPGFALLSTGRALTVEDFEEEYGKPWASVQPLIGTRNYDSTSGKSLAHLRHDWAHAHRVYETYWAPHAQVTADMGTRRQLLNDLFRRFRARVEATPEGVSRDALRATGFYIFRDASTLLNSLASGSLLTFRYSLQRWIIEEPHYLLRLVDPHDLGGVFPRFMTTDWDTLGRLNLQHLCAITDIIGDWIHTSGGWEIIAHSFPFAQPDQTTPPPLHDASGLLPCP